jgi:hypothetical protein
MRAGRQLTLPPGWRPSVGTWMPVRAPRTKSWADERQWPEPGVDTDTEMQRWAMDVNERLSTLEDNAVASGELLKVLSPVVRWLVRGMWAWSFVLIGAGIVWLWFETK